MGDSHLSILEENPYAPLCANQKSARGMIDPCPRTAARRAKRPSVRPAGLGTRSQPFHGKPARPCCGRRTVRPRAERLELGSGPPRSAVFGAAASASAAALAEFRTLQAEYEAWRDGLPESLAESRTAEFLEGVCDVDLDALDVELPRGFGRD